MYIPSRSTRKASTSETKLSTVFKNYLRRRKVSSIQVRHTQFLLGSITNFFCNLQTFFMILSGSVFDSHPVTGKHYRGFHRLFLLRHDYRFLLQFSNVFYYTRWLWIVTQWPVSNTKIYMSSSFSTSIAEFLLLFLIHLNVIVQTAIRGSNYDL